MPHYYAHIHQLCSINPKLTYPLVASSMSNTQLKSIQSIIHPSVIASKGFNRHWPEGLRYGNHKYCGLDLIDFRVEQRLRKIQLIHKLLFHPKHKILIQSIIEWYHISAGLTGQILANPSTKVNYINSIWFNDLLYFMAKSQITIHTNDFFSVNLQRNNDQSIMSEINKLHLSKQQKIQINACRLYLQVATLSDIVNPDGKTINQHFLEVKKPIQPRSTLKWPNQPLPSHQACKLWRKTILQVFNITNSNILPRNQQLQEWIVPYSLRQMSHRWNYSKEQHEIYELHNNNIYRYFIEQK